MMNRSTSYRKHVKEIERFNINSKWRSLIVARIKEDINEVEEPEEIPDILENWNWMRSKQRDSAIEVIRAISLLKSATIRRIVHKIIRMRDMWIDYSDMEKPDADRYFDNLRKKVTGALEALGECSLISTVPITKEEVGPGKRAVTLYCVIWARDKDKEKARSWYLAKGGALGVKAPEKPKKPQTPKGNARWGNLRKYESWKNKAFEKSSTHTHVLCPNSCKVSFVPYPTVDFKDLIGRDGKLTLTCKKCDTTLIMVNPVEYARKKFESIYPLKIEDLEKEFSEK